MKRALVLGGGGPVGIAWQTGLAVGLARHGTHVDAADLVIGTSAGSVVGAQLAGGLEVQARAESVYLEPPGAGGTAADRALAGEVDRQVAAGMVRLIDAVGALADPGPPGAEPELALAALGRRAEEAAVGPEEDFVGLFAELAEHEWPERFVCTAVETATGRFTVWDRSSGVPLDRGVAASCSVPFVFPPVTVRGRRYIDGGMRSGLNADLAAGCDAVLVVSAIADLPPGLEVPSAQREARSRAAQFDRLRAGGSAVELVVPSEEFVRLSGLGLHLMDAARAPAAYAMGLRQADVEADRLGAVWRQGA